MKDYYTLVPRDDKHYRLLPGYVDHYRLIPSSSADFDLIPTDETHYTLISVDSESFSRFDTLKAILQRVFSQKGVYWVRITKLPQKLQEVIQLWIS